MANKPLHDDNFYLGHIKDAINSVNEYLSDMDYDSFCQNKLVIDAVIRQIEIIGEASNNLSDNFKNSHPQMLFRDIIDMRNFLAHEYFGVNTKVVWDTCKNDLPELKDVINSI
jgi:uncharacterized protein with HEPN domain